MKAIKKYFSDVLSELNTAVSTLCIISGQLNALTKAVADNRSEQTERIAQAVEHLSRVADHELKQTGYTVVAENLRKGN